MINIYSALIDTRVFGLQSPTKRARACTSLSRAARLVGQIAPRVPLQRRAAIWPILFLSWFTAACAYNPLLDRDQLILVPDSELVSMAQSSWSAIAQETPVSRDAGKIARVDRIGARVLSGMGEKTAVWEIKVFEDESLNAFALPGGKIGMNTGMVAFCRSDDELAAVIGHEIAHVKLRHAAERVSQQLAAQGLVDLVGGESAETAALLGAGATLGVILPFSRQHELEADRLGLRYMAAAGYDPMSAVNLWTRMAAEKARAQTPAWLSTHPADEDRIAAIRREAARLSAGSS